MNKMIALFCAALIAVSSSAAIVMADEAETNESAPVSDVADAPSGESGSGDSGSDAGNDGGDNNTDGNAVTSTVENSDAISEGSPVADKDGKKESASVTEGAKESDTKVDDKKGSDADTEDKKVSDTDDKASETETIKDAEQPAATEAPAEENTPATSAPKATGGGGGSVAEPTVTADPSATAEPSATADPSATAEPSATADPSATAEPSATADPSATAEPTATEKPAENKEKADEKSDVVMKRPFTLVKSYDANPFNDCQSGWYANYVSFAYANKIIVGYNDNTFDPFGKITGSQLAVMLYRISTGRTDIVTEGDEWSDEAIAWVKKNKIMSDFADDDFDTDAYLTREEVICSFYRAYSLYNKAEEGGKIDHERFPDAGKVSEFALPAMEWAVASKIITGKGDKWIDPTSNVTRAEASAIFKRYLENLEFEDVPVEVKPTSSQKAKTEEAKDTAEETVEEAKDTDEKVTEEGATETVSNVSETEATEPKAEADTTVAEAEETAAEAAEVETPVEPAENEE